ncbi:MAG: lysylphosphatidylglycerol synthase transmembrane domain-containing protein [Gemmatimonadaceae bacterium]
MRVGWKGALGIALSVMLLAYAFRGVPTADVIHRLRGADPLLLIASAVVGTTIFPLRARRWRVILEPVEPHVAFVKLWHATAIGMMINNVVPARAGEIARAYVLSREVPRVPFAAALASLAIDRVFDAVVVLLLMLLALLDPAFPSDTAIAGRPIANWAGSGIIVVVAAAAVLYALAVFPARLIALFELFARRVAPRIEERGRTLLVAFSEGLGVLRSPRRFSAVFAWTLLHWLVNGAAFWLAFRAVGITAPATAAWFLQGLIAIGVAVPAAPGFFGVFEAFGKLGLGVYGIGESQAVTWAVGFHILSFIPITLIGAWYFARLGLKVGDIAASADDAPKRTS